jgi:hypothetical protein
MKKYRPRRPRGVLAVAAFLMSAAALSVLVMLPFAVESRVPEFAAGAGEAAIANR